MSQVKLPKNYKPTKKEDYMGPKQLEYFRLKLLIGDNPCWKSRSRPLTKCVMPLAT